MTEELFAHTLKTVIHKYLKSEFIRNCFRSCGLFPWNPEAIDFTKCTGKKRNESDSTESNIANRTSITYQEFRSIINQEMINKFESSTEAKSLAFPENLLQLFRVYKIFKNKSLVEENKNSDKTNTVPTAGSDTPVLIKSPAKEGLAAPVPNIVIYCLNLKFDSI